LEKPRSLTSLLRCLPSGLLATNALDALDAFAHAVSVTVGVVLVVAIPEERHAKMRLATTQA
jgi:hypothetical protein